MFCRLGTIILLVLLAPGLMAQSASISGFVTEEQTGIALRGANVLLHGSGDVFFGTVVEEDGAFYLGAIPAGRYDLKASFVGYDNYVDSLTLRADERLTLKITLTPSPEYFGEVVIISDRRGPEEYGIAGMTTVTPAALARVPMPGVSSDLTAYLLTMPGVVLAGDRGGQLYVRGGTPTQNLVLIDGIPVYQPFHIVGFYSAFPGDIIANADVYAGGFGAEFGGRLSSVIDVKTRNGSKRRVSGAASIAPFLSSVRLEGPLVQGKVSLMGSVRESIIERVSPNLLATSLPYRFGDQFLKVHAYLNTTSSFSATALRTFDEGDLAGTGDRQNRIYWRNQALGGRYLYLPAEYPVLTELAVSYTTLDSEFGPDISPQREAQVRGVRASIDFAYLLGDFDLDFGTFVRMLRFRYSLGDVWDQQTTTEGGLYVEAHINMLRRVSVHPGLRLHSFPAQNRLSFEPRLRFSWYPIGRHRPHAGSAAFGLYRQDIVGLHDERDIAGVFTAWAPAPTDMEVARAFHSIAGWRSRIRPWLEGSIEAYHKLLSNLTVFTGTTGFGNADGAAVGADIRIEVTRPFFFGYVSYGLSRVKYNMALREAEELQFRPPHDRRHHVNVMGRLVRGSWSISARWEFGSGLPFTEVEGFYNEIHPIRASTEFLTAPGQTRVLYGQPYKGRLPAYHRLDISLERNFRLPRVDGKLQAGLVNAYDRRNVFFYDLFDARRVNQLPLIPSVGVKVEVK